MARARYVVSHKIDGIIVSTHHLLMKARESRAARGSTYHIYHVTQVGKWSKVV